jgi:Ser/Thr protein kinase RdoA (MazF antagonist)
MHPDLLSAACHLYGTSPSLLNPLSGGNYNTVYLFLSTHNGFSGLRIGAEDCPLSQTLGMLEWVRFLKDEGAPVAAPIPSIHGRLVESLEQDGTRYTITVFETASGIRAELIPPAEWTDELFQNIGRAAGMMHRISRHFVPPAPELTRPHWFESSVVRQALTLLHHPTPARTSHQPHPRVDTTPHTT